MDFLDMRLLSFIGIKKIPDAPWKKYYKNSDMTYKISNENIYDYLVNSIKSGKYENKIAINYYNNLITYKDFLKRIDECSLKFQKLGIKKYTSVGS